MKRRRFNAFERPEGPPQKLDQAVADEASVAVPTAALIRRHIDSYFRLVPKDALRLTGALISTEGLYGDNEAWQRQLADDIYAHTKQSIRCEVGLITWLVLLYRLYQIIRLVIEIYQADPAQMGSVAGVPATSPR